MKILKFLNFIVIATAMAISGCNSGGDASTQGGEQATSYQLVVDSGSSGSRIYVYNKQLTESGMSITDLYESKINIPLASFASSPTEAGAKGIQPLLLNAIKFLQSRKSDISLTNVPTSVLGTAGMHLISESQQKEIYQNVADTILAAGLKLNETKTISGQYEGLYSWADVNYLRGSFSKQNSTDGILEVGGASAQIAFATPQTTGNNIINITIENKDYNVYTISLLGLGQDVARSNMNQMANYNACYPQGYNKSQLSIDDNFNYSDCSSNYNQIIALYPELDQIKDIPGFFSQSFIGVSAVYYVLNFWGIKNNAALLTHSINTTCDESYSEIMVQHSNAYKVENQCANSVLVDSLFNTLSFNKNQLTAVELINNTPLTWTLGYVLLNV